MANISPTTAAIDMIAQHLSHAAEAACALDAMAAQDLRSLLHIAGCEAERVRKASRKAARKTAAKATEKHAAKRERGVMVKAAPQQTRGRRKAATANGAAH